MSSGKTTDAEPLAEQRQHAITATTTVEAAAAINTWISDFDVKSYAETGRKVAPWKRQVHFAVHSPPRRWHVLATFVGSIEGSEDRQKRRSDLKDLCFCIDWSHYDIQLVDGAVTELVIRRSHDHDDASYHWYSDDPSSRQRLALRSPLQRSSDFAPIADRLQVIVRENPRQVQFPSYIGNGGTPTRHISELITEGRQVHAISKVRLASDDKKVFIFKTVQRFGYVRGDSEALEQELRVLEELRSATDGLIVHLAGIVISENPYRTIEDDRSTVLRGMLLEYHPNGTLKDAISLPKPHMTWGLWGLQIARALACLHERNLPNMDLKPENVVISKEYNAVMIDVGGMDGCTREWLAPEMLDKEAQGQDPMLQDAEARKQNDIWALGKIFSAMADVSCDEEEKRLLIGVAKEALTVQVPRICLRDVIFRLSRAG